MNNKENFLLRILGQKGLKKGPKMMCYLTSVHGLTFLSFCLDLKFKDVKLTQIIFFPMKAFCFEVFGPILAQLEPRMRFFKFCVKSMHGTFLNLQHHKGLKLTQMIFLWENLALLSLNKKLSRMSFLSFITNQCSEFF